MGEGTPTADTRPTAAAEADATTARIAVTAAGFALGTLFERAPDARVDLEPAIAAPDDRVLLVIRTDATSQSEVAAALRADPSVTAVEYLADRGDGWVFGVAWDGQPRRFLARVRAEDATILSARGGGGTWTLQLLLPDRDALTRAYEAIVDCECGTELERIGTYGGGRGDRFDLTDEQREALVAAFEAGYYEVPREVTAADLADRLGISHQALSERFRRAYGQIVGGTVVDGRGSGPE
ncbi:helix-turn-helix domain-containing protein [Halococcus agarilyticus]|uniref:helix-turn-helix domain-containing protein n=1 Tax=Halococcus agarilyticus TaxID=1232219 RepID=UPI000677B257|nr:helix-turn-helix domain-containing protein [Halococcus agarilyticus]